MIYTQAHTEEKMRLLRQKSHKLKPQANIFLGSDDTLTNIQITMEFQKIIFKIIYSVLLKIYNNLQNICAWSAAGEKPLYLAYLAQIYILK